MRRQARAALLSVALLLPALPAHAQAPVAPPATEAPSLELQKSFGCLASGTAGTLAAIGFGPENLVNLVSGGIVTPANSAVLAIGVVGVVFASFCSVGESLTPSVLYMADHAAPAATHLAEAARATAAEALEAATTAARATGTALAEALPTLDATIEAAEATLAATQRLATAALATATEALEAARTATPSAWAESGRNALTDLCRQSSLCRAHIPLPPTPQ